MRGLEQKRSCRVAKIKFTAAKERVRDKSRHNDRDRVEPCRPKTSKGGGTEGRRGGVRQGEPYGNGELRTGIACKTYDTQGRHPGLICRRTSRAGKTSEEGLSQTVPDIARQPRVVWRSVGCTSARQGHIQDASSKKCCSNLKTTSVVASRPEGPRDPRRDRSAADECSGSLAEKSKRPNRGFWRVSRHGEMSNRGNRQRRVQKRRVSHEAMVVRTKKVTAATTDQYRTGLQRSHRGRTYDQRQSSKRYSRSLNNKEKVDVSTHDYQRGQHQSVDRERRAGRQKCQPH